MVNLFLYLHLWVFSFCLFVGWIVSGQIDFVLNKQEFSFRCRFGATGRWCDFVLGERGRKAVRNVQVFTLMHHGIQQLGLKDDDVVNVKNLYLYEYDSCITALTFITSLSSPTWWTIANIWTHTPAAIHTHGLTHTCRERERVRGIAGGYLQVWSHFM